MKQLKKIFILCLVGSCLFYTACNKSIEPEPNRLGYNFFPLAIGNFWIYTIEEKEYTLLDPVKITTHQLKEVAIDTFLDINAQESFILERYTRANENEAWELDSIWSATLTPNRAIKTENSQAFVKLIFPLAENLTWNGNILNNYGERMYALEEFKTPYKINENLNFPISLKVLQRNDSSLVNQIREVERYAEDVGLIYKEKINIAYDDSPEFLGQGKIKFGKIITQTITEYGKE